MKTSITIKEKYTQRTLPFGSYVKYVKMPFVTVILKNPNSGEPDGSTSQFLVDTGAAISIINKRYESFIKNLTPYDSILIQYGAGKSRKCPVYKIIAIIKGTEVTTSFAYDDGCEFLVLGHFDFFENLSYTLLDSLTGYTLLVKK